MMIDFHTTQSMLETMNEQDYAFFLAYGLTQEQEELESLLDVEMYPTIDDSPRELEAGNSTVLY